MVVEHEFITTLGADEAIPRLNEFLLARGFSPSGGNAFQARVGPTGGAAGAEGWSRLTVARGKKKAKRVKRFGDLPQTVVAAFDRGRVEVAFLVEPFLGRVKDVHKSAALSFARALEEVVADPDRAARTWDSAERRADDFLARKRRNYHIVLFVILGACLLPIVLIAILAVTGK